MMSKARQFTYLSVILLLCATLLACARNANNADSDASKFIGTWKVDAESEIDFKGGPITFKEDKTYSAQKTTDPSSPIITGPFTVKDRKLFLGGELTKFGEAGMTIEADGRMKLIRGDKVIYFVKV